MDSIRMITNTLNETVADVFMMETEYIAAHHELNFMTDLIATSLQYYPLITELEELLDIDIDVHDFQSKLHTIGDAADFLVGLYTEQKGEEG